MNHVGLFSGILGFEEAFRRAGAILIGVCEIDTTCQKVIRRHRSDVRIFNDVKEIQKDSFADGSIDILTGGFPCQDLSVAGLRKGLVGERSGLWFEFIRIIADHKPRWVVVENVPGLLSSNRGRDFAVILSGLVKCGYGVCWRVFDSQFDGVAQRRARVFIVASLGSGRCAQVLFEREGGAWDSPPSREAGEDITGTLSSRTSAGGGLGTDFDCNGGLQPISRTLAALGAGSERPAGQGDELDFLIPFGLIGNGEYADRPATLRSKGGDCGRGSEYLIAGTMRSNSNAHGGFANGEGLIAGTVSGKWAKGTAGSSGDERQNLVVVSEVVASREIAQSLTSNYGKQADNSDTALGPNLVIAFAQNTRDEVRYINGDGQIAGALASGSGMKQQSYVSGQFRVRRLTPTECERLQGFPDFWTAFDDQGKPISDSARYRMLGNAVCAPTAEWIAKRIIVVDNPSTMK